MKEKLINELNELQQEKQQFVRICLWQMRLYRADLSTYVTEGEAFHTLKKSCGSQIV